MHPRADPAKPALNIVATGTPHSQHWSITAGTDDAGTMMNAWSMGPGAASRSG